MTGTMHEWVAIAGFSVVAGDCQTCAGRARAENQRQNGSYVVSAAAKGSGSSCRMPELWASVRSESREMETNGAMHHPLKTLVFTWFSAP